MTARSSRSARRPSCSSGRSHTFVGYFIGSPGMNVLPVTIEGSSATLGSQTIELPGAPKPATPATIELGIRPEYVRLGRDGHAGRRSARSRISAATRSCAPASKASEIAVIVGEDEEIPAEPKIALRPAASTSTPIPGASSWEA